MALNHHDYLILPTNPTWCFRPGLLTQVTPLDELDGSRQMYRLVWRTGRGEGSREMPVDMAYIECLVDGVRVTGDVVRHADGSMELCVFGSKRRIPLFDRNAEPNPHIKPAKE